MARNRSQTPAMPPPPRPLEPGEVVGTYRIVRQLGAGGMGAVYEAEHLHMGSKAAIKVLLPELSTNPDAVTRFVNEARAASSLKHRHIVTVHDCAQRPDGQWFIVLQYVEGGSLKKKMQTTGGPMALGDVVSIVGQTANALHAAHEHDIIHRDVKPENVLLAQSATNPADDHVTLADFGIAKLSKARGGSGTRAGTVVGTPNYMAPEHLRGHAIDRRADVYALGVVAWEMLTGEHLWGDGTDEPTVIIERQATGARPLDPCAVRGHIPPAMGAAVAAALAPDAAKRWPTAQGFALALAHGLVSEWGEKGIEILRRVASELTIAPPETTDTAGRPVPAPNANTPTVRVVAPAAAAPTAPVAVPHRTPGAVPIVPLPEPVGAPPSAQLTPPAPQLGRADVPTAAGIEPRGTISLSVSVAESPGTVAEPDGPARRRRRRALVAGLAAAGLAAVVVAIVAAGGGGASSTAPAAPVAPAAPAGATISAIAIVTEPAGATVHVDGAPRGAAPVNVAAAVGAEVEIRAELAGHATASQRVTVGPDPATVRLTLTPMVDAGAARPAAAAAPPLDAGASPTDAGPPIDARPRPTRPRGDRRGEGGFDPDGVVQP